LNEFWQTSFELDTTAPIVILLIGIFVVGLGFLLLRLASTLAVPRAVVAIVPSILATVGVLGTFFGIWLGLQDFDVKSIDDSVPALLEGLKTAFVTSLWGMALSVLYRMAASLLPARSSSTGSAIEALGALISEQRRARESTEAGFEALRRSIAGDEDGSLVVQIGRVRNELRDQTATLEGAVREELGSARTEMTDHHNEHIKELRDFARHMVENTNKSLIETLQNVIDDFNDKLMNQFGENFRELNVAVGRLLEWQEKYKSHVDQTEQRINSALAAIERTSTAIEQVERSAAAIPTAVEPLEPVLGAIEMSLDRVNRDLAAYAELHDKARAAFPLVNDNLDTMTGGLREAVESMISRTDEALVRQERSHSTLEAAYGTVLMKADAAQDRFATSVDETMNLVGDKLTGAADALGKDLHETLAETDQRLKQQVETLDKALGDELQKALATLASNLGGMSEQFVTDYEPLTKQLNGLIEMARAANEPVRLQAG